MKKPSSSSSGESDEVSYGCGYEWDHTLVEGICIECDAELYDPEDYV